MTWIVVGVVLASTSLLAWGWFEAGWLRRRVLEVRLEGVPPELDGVRIAHLSDFHLGVPGRGPGAAERAVDWVASRRPDLVCVTGDLLSRRSGAAHLDRLLRELAPCIVVLGNHDLDVTRDPFSQRVDVASVARVDGVTLLADESVEIELRGVRTQVVGVDPRSYAAHEAHPHDLADPAAPFRLLLCHFPGVARRIPAGVFHLVLSGHLHGGQIVVPYPGGRLRLAHLGAREAEGVYRHGATALHVSPGLGTTFVPFRLFARPEVTELVVRSG